MTSSWKRPTDLKLPTTWSVVEGKLPLGQNGKIPRFRIQEATPELHADMIKQMATYFLRDEPMCACVGLVNDREAVDEVIEMWKKVLSLGMALVAVVDNYEELGDPSLPRVAGCNMTYPVFPDSPKPQIKNGKFYSVFKLMDEMCDEADCFNRFQVPVIMTALGLSVDPAYRGQGLATNLLKARFPMGRAMGVKLTTTVFSTPKSQIPAEKAGFLLLNEIPAGQYKENGQVIFKKIENDIMKNMYAVIN